MATIGVVVATYNGERFIEEQLESICQQTIKPDTIVVTDGGSKDYTIEICRSISKKYEKIKWVILQSDHQLNVAENFEKGMNNCSSDIVFLCDQDDFWYKYKIEKYKKVFDSHMDCTVVISNADVVDSELKKTGKTQWDAIKFTPSNEALDRETWISEMLHRNIFTGMCMAYRRGAFSYADIKSEYMLHDEAIGWYAIFNGKVRILNESTAAYRQHGNNAVGSRKYHKFRTVNASKKLIMESTARVKNKTADLIMLYKNNGDISLIYDANAFYCERCKIYERKSMKSMFKILKWIGTGQYGLFSSKTDRAAMKDIFFIIA